ncbi:MAG: type II toxin-antitoxin system VapC family toxin [Desulfobacteraceae bacterium]|nr:type II toxin-antitoxin system VapC family toxin [Desulfobacteraceae bacterium]
MKYLLDTCLISELPKPVPNQKVVDWLRKVPSASLFISVITIGEIRKGLSKLQPSEKKERLTDWLDTLLKLYSKRILPVDLKVAEKWGELQGNAEKIGKPMSSVDSLLAATANVHKMAIVTRNESDFEEGEIRIVNPWTLL